MAAREVQVPSAATPGWCCPASLPDPCWPCEQDMVRWRLSLRQARLPEETEQILSWARSEPIYLTPSLSFVPECHCALLPQGERAGASRTTSPVCVQGCRPLKRVLHLQAGAPATPGPVPPSSARGRPSLLRPNRERGKESHTGVATAVKEMFSFDFP